MVNVRKFMIVDNLQNLSAYISVNRYFAKIADYMRTHDLASLEIGRYVIDEDNVFLNIQNEPMKSKDDAKIECHRKMIDIQVPLTEAETYGYADVTNRDVVGFDEKNDIGFLPEMSPLYYLTCKVGMFAVFFPQDGHAPMIGNTSKKIKKAIFKVKM